jgi:hypothetical protein
MRSKPGSDQLQVAGVVEDRTVGQPRRGTRQYKPGQHVGIEVSEILLAHQCTVITQVADQGQSQPALPQLHRER